MVPLYVEEKYHKQSLLLKNIKAMIPAAQENLETSSIFSAFVVAVTARVIAEEVGFKRLEPLPKELLLVKTLLRAQQSAYIAVAECDEYGGEGRWGSLLSDEVMEHAVEDIRANKLSALNQVTKEGSDRVTSIVLFRIDLYMASLISASMSRLTRQSSSRASNGTDGKSSPYPRFVAHETVKRYSKPFTSAADISLFNQRFDNTMPLLSHVSVSGSIRTVEAAASVTIRMLLEKKSPAEAIRSPAALYDPRDKKFYCEHDKDFLQLLYLTYKIVCEDMRTGDKDMQDRVVMALKVKAANVGHSDRYIEAAVSRQPTEYNYPVGN